MDAIEMLGLLSTACLLVMWAIIPGKGFRSPGLNINREEKAPEVSLISSPKAQHR